MAQGEMQVEGVEREQIRIVGVSARRAAPLERTGAEWEECGSS